MKAEHRGVEEDIDFLIPMGWYWVRNRGVWRGPMQWMNPEYSKFPGFWFPEFEGEFERENFSLNLVDANTLLEGVRYIPEPEDS